MTFCLVGLGSNLGDRQTTLDDAVTRLGQVAGRLVAASDFFGSVPIGGPAGQPEFLNAVVLIQTGLDPHELLAELQAVEREFGRERSQAWAARTLDLDLLLYDDLVVHTESLTVPHPALVARSFVLGPAAQVAADWHHPELGWTIQQLWDHLRRSPDRFVIVGNEADLVAAAVAADVGAKLLPSERSRDPRRRVAAGSPRPDPSLAIESLQQRVRAAINHHWNSVPSGDRCVAAVDPAESWWSAWWEADERQRLEWGPLFHQALEPLAMPKLAIVLAGAEMRAPDHPVFDHPVSGDPVSGDSWLSDGPSTLAVDEALRFFRQHRCCPWLVVESGGDDRLRMVAGAMRAMAWPS